MSAQSNEERKRANSDSYATTRVMISDQFSPIKVFSFSVFCSTGSCLLKLGIALLLNTFKSALFSLLFLCVKIFVTESCHKTWEKIVAFIGSTSSQPHIHITKAQGIQLTKSTCSQNQHPFESASSIPASFYQTTAFHTPKVLPMAKSPPLHSFQI